MKIEQVSILDLRHAEYNPRILSPKDAQELLKSITEFGFIQPLVVNSFGDRKGIIIGGNQRYEMAKILKMETVPVVWVSIKNDKKERELNLRLNRNQGKWDWDELANIGMDELLGSGFEVEELEFHFGEWSTDFDKLKKSEKTSQGIIATIKIACPQELKSEIEEKIRDVIKDFSDASIIS